MSHQTLQHLQRNTGVQHMHGVGIAEHVRGYRHGERHPVGRHRFNRLAEPGADRAVGDTPDTCLLGSAGAFIAPFQRDFQGGVMV